MKNDMQKRADLGQRLQEDIDAILADVGHLFDDVADYARETDPLHQLDIDLVLSHEFKPQVHLRPVVKYPARMKLYQAKVAVAHKTSTAHMERKAPMRAMPKRLQEEVRIYERKIAKPRGFFSRSLKLLFKPFEY